MSGAYLLAQRAMADLKAAVYSLLEAAPAAGLSNAEIGRNLGIYAGHVEHEGHISRTLLALMEKEGVVQQIPSSKRWLLRRHGPGDTGAEAVGSDDGIASQQGRAANVGGVGERDLQAGQRAFPRTIASAPKSEKTDITVTVRWDLVGQGQPETIRERSAAATLSKLLVRVCEVRGDGVLQQLCKLRTGRRAIVSPNPAQDFVNQSTGELYKHYRIGGTGYFVLTQTNTDMKIETLKDIVRLLSLPEHFLEIQKHERVREGA